MYRTKVLIVEDNTVVAEDCRHCLESFGYEVLPISSSAEESIKMAKKSKPDVVLMDIKLRDEMDGIEAAEQINAKFNIPVVFLSAYSDKPLLKRASQVGSFGYLIKPFADRELYATLEMAVQRSKADQQCRLDEEKNSIALKMQIKKNLVKIKDINTTLDILMEKRVNEQLRTEETIHTNFKLFVFPFIEKLKKSLRTKREQSILSILESEIVNVVSPFSRKLSTPLMSLTPTEIKIANLIKLGKTNKEMALVLGKSIHTICSHRESIREKVNLKNKKANLRSYLMSIS